MFEPHNEVERLLIAAAGDVAARRAFVDAAMASDLYVSPLGAPPPGGGLGPIVIALRPDGRGGAAVFTSRERVAEALGAGASVSRRPGRDLLAALRRGGVHINPTLDFSVIWTPADLQEIFDGSRPVFVPQDARALPIRREDIPLALASALSAALETRAGVSEAWLALVERPGHPPGWLLGVDLFGAWREIDLALQAAVAAVDLEGRVFAALPLEDNPLSRALRAGIPIVAP